MRNSPLTAESLKNVPVYPQSKEPPANVLVSSPPEESLKDVHISAQSVALLETVFVAMLPGDRRRVLVEHRCTFCQLNQSIPKILHKNLYLLQMNLVLQEKHL